MYAMLLAVMLLASCSGEKHYVDVLPEKPGAVFAFDVQALVRKSDLPAEDIRAIADELKGAMDGGADAESAELMDKMLENPQESGLDFGRKMYLFADEKADKGGLLACVKDKAKLDASVRSLETRRIEDKGDYTQAVVGKGILAYSESSCLLLYSETESETALQAWASALMEQEGKGTFSQSEAFAGMERLKSDMTVYASMALLPEDYKALIKASAPTAADWEAVDIVAGVRFEKGRMLVDVETLVSGEMKKEYEKMRAIYSAKTSGKYLKLFPRDGFMWMNTGMKGEKLYETLEEEPAVAAQLQSIQALFDLKSLLEAVDGELVFGISSVQPVKFALLAEVKDAGFMTSFGSLKSMLDMTGGRMQLLETGPHAYELKMPDSGMAGMPSGIASVYIGVKDGVFYLTSDKQCAELKEAEHSMRESAWAGNASDKRFFMAMNWDAISPFITGGYTSKDMIGRMLQNGMDYITLEAQDETHGHIEVSMKDKETNALKQWIEMGKALSRR